MLSWGVFVGFREVFFDGHPVCLYALYFDYGWPKFEFSLIRIEIKIGIRIVEAPPRNSKKRLNEEVQEEIHIKKSNDARKSETSKKKIRMEIPRRQNSIFFRVRKFELLLQPSIRHRSPPI